MSKSKKQKSETFSCTRCGRDISLKSNYYGSGSELYKITKRLSVCKDCTRKVYDRYFEVYEDKRKAIYYTCRKLDIVYSESVYKSSINDKRKYHPFAMYMMKLNSLGKVNNDGASATFDDSDSIEDKEIKKKQDEKEAKKEVKRQIEVKQFDENDPKFDLDKNDIRIKNDVVRLLGRDPFAGYSKYDQKYLYNGLIGYLDEDTLEDQFKVGIYIQLLNMELQVTKIDYNISQITKNIDSLLANSDKLKSLTSLKKDIINAADKIAKENSISVKNRNDQKAGKSTLGYMMSNLRDLGFQDAEVDYYSQKVCYGMQRVAEISMNAMQKNLQFDENDTNDIIQIQREKIQSQEKKVLELEEELRKANIELNKK